MRKKQSDNRKYMIPAKPMVPPCMRYPGYQPGNYQNPEDMMPWSDMQPRTPSSTPSITLPIQPPSMQPPSDSVVEPGPPVTTDIGYIQAHLKEYIGYPVKVQFILGTNMFVDREGELIDVGIDHIVLRENRTDDLLFADLYSIKFVTIYQ